MASGGGGGGAGAGAGGPPAAGPPAVGGAGAGGAAAAAGGGGAPPAPAPRSIPRRVLDAIRFIATITGNGIAEMFEKGQMTLADIIRLVRNGDILYIPPPWVTALRANGGLTHEEYAAIIAAGTRAMTAALAVIRNYAVFKSYYDPKKKLSQTNNRLRDSAISVLKGIILYHTYTYFKLRNRADDERIAREVYGLSTEEPSLYRARSGEEVEHLENMWQLNDSLNNILIPAYAEIAEEMGIESGGGARDKAEFPRLRLLNAAGAEIDASEADDNIVAAAMERYIRAAETYLDAIDSALRGSGNGGVKEGRRDEHGGFTGALDALTGARASGRDASVGILDAIRALLGAGAVGAALAGNGGGGGGNYNAFYAAAPAAAPAVLVQNPVLALLADPPAGAGAGAPAVAIAPEIVGAAAAAVDSGAGAAAATKERAAVAEAAGARIDEAMRAAHGPSLPASQVSGFGGGGGGGGYNSNNGNGGAGAGAGGRAGRVSSGFFNIAAPRRGSSGNSLGAGAGAAGSSSAAAAAAAPGPSSSAGSTGAKRTRYAAETGAAESNAVIAAREAAAAGGGGARGAAAAPNANEGGVGVPNPAKKPNTGAGKPPGNQNAGARRTRRSRSARKSHRRPTKRSASRKVHKGTRKQSKKHHTTRSRKH